MDGFQYVIRFDFKLKPKPTEVTFLGKNKEGKKKRGIEGRIEERKRQKKRKK